MMLRNWVAPLGLHIEPAEPHDAEAVAKLHAKSFYQGWPSADVEAYLLDRDMPTLVVCNAKRRIAGFAMLRLLGEEAELMTIAVEKNFQGKGVATALIRACFADLMTTASKRLILEVAADNPPALALYKKLGFRQIGERHGYYARPDGRVAAALVMTRDLL